MTPRVTIASDHLERPLSLRRWEGAVECRERRGVELEVGGPANRAHVFLARRLGNGAYARVADRPGERHLGGGDIEVACDGRDRGMARERPLVERRISHDVDVARRTPSEEVELGAPAGEVVEHLVGGDVVAVAQRRELLEVRDVEVRNAPARDLA